MLAEVEDPTDEEGRYLAAAKREFVKFAGKPEKYREFDAILIEFRSGRWGCYILLSYKYNCLIVGHEFTV